MAESSGIRLYEMAREGEMTDVALVVQGKEIAAHSPMAASRGGTLKDLLKANLLKQNPEKRVNIGDDMEPQIFETVLKYIYTDTVKLCDENLFDLVFAAKKLQLKDLEKRCADFLETKITVKNVVNFTEQALQFESEDCTATCVEYFKTNTQSVIKSAQFLEISNGTLQKLCESEKFNCSDSDLFLACVKWAEKECQRSNTGTSPEEMRTALGDVLHKIRFSRMTLEELMKTVVPTGILTDEALGKVIYSLGKGPNIKVSIGEVFGFDRISGYFTRSSSVGDVKKFISESKEWSEWITDDFHHAHSCSLGHDGKQLSDDTSLASLYTGEDLVLDVHSYRVTVKSEKSGPDSFEFPLVIQGMHFDEDENIIKAYVNVLQGIPCDEISAYVVLQDGTLSSCDEHYAQPGGTVIIKGKKGKLVGIPSVSDS